MAAKTWSGVTIAVESAKAASQTVSGITAANPPVVTYVGTDPSNLDYILMTAQGMTQIDNRIVRVSNVNAGGNTFECDDLNGLGFTAFSSGGMEPLTLGTSITNATGVTASGGEWETQDITTIHDVVRKTIPTVASPLTIQLTCYWDPADAGLQALLNASDTKDTRAILISFADATRIAFNGYVACSLLPTGTAQGLVETSVTITAYGRTSTFVS